MANNYTADRVSAGGNGIYSDGAGAAAYAGTVAGLSLASAFGLAAGSYAAPGVPAYAGAVAGLSFAVAISVAAGTYTAPGAPAYNGTVDGLIFAASWSVAAGQFAEGAPSALPRYTITAKPRRLEIRK